MFDIKTFFKKLFGATPYFAYSNGRVTVNLNGIMKSKTCTKEEALEVKENLNNPEWLIQFFHPDLDQTVREYQKVDILKQLGNEDFEINETDKCVYMRGVETVPMPQKLVDVLIKAKEENNPTLLMALKNFWRLSALAYNAETRADMFDFLSYSNIQITPEGWFVAYRALTLHEGLQTYAAEIGELNKTKWKENYRNFHIYCELEEGLFVKQKFFYTRKKEGPDNFPNGSARYWGNLRDILDEKVFTDKHTGTMRIREFEPVSLPIEEVDFNPANECSKGLHFTSATSYNRWYGSFGDFGAIVLINPMDVASVPTAYAGTKGRAISYLPVKIQKDLTFNEGDVYEVPDEVRDILKKRNIQNFEELVDEIDPHKEKYPLPTVVGVEDLGNYLSSNLVEEIQKRRDETELPKLKLYQDDQFDYWDDDDYDPDYDDDDDDYDPDYDDDEY